MVLTSPTCRQLQT